MAAAEQTFPSNLKLLLIGNSSVGKSSLLLRFTDDDFLAEEETTATIGVDFKVKSIELDGRKYKLSIWDTAGQERFRSLTSSYYRGAQGIILVYDVSSRKTFEELFKWFQEIDRFCGDQVVKLIVGNKIDKEFSRQVLTAEGEDFAKRMGTLFVGGSNETPKLTEECSAKANLGVEEAFQELVAQIIDTPSLWSKGAQPVRPAGTTRNDTVDVAAEDGSWLPSLGCSC